MSELAIMVLRFFSCLFVFFVASKTTIAYDLFSSHKKHKKPQNGPDTTWIAEVHVIAIERSLCRQDGSEIDVSLGTEMTSSNS